MRFAFVAKYRNIWPVAWLCEALDVSRLGFPCLAPSRAQQAHAGRRDHLRKGVGELTGSDRTYGARRVWRDVLAEGLDCGLHLSSG